MVIGVLLAAVLLSAVGVEGAGWDTADCGAAGKPVSAGFGAQTKFQARNPKSAKVKAKKICFFGCRCARKRAAEVLAIASTC